MLLEAVVEKPGRPGPPVQPVPVPPARPEVVAEAASRSEVAGWPNCCLEGEARQRDLTLILMLSWDLLELSRGEKKTTIQSYLIFSRLVLFMNCSIITFISFLRNLFHTMTEKIIFDLLILELLEQLKYKGIRIFHKKRRYFDHCILLHLFLY